MRPPVSVAPWLLALFLAALAGCGRAPGARDLSRVEIILDAATVAALHEAGRVRADPWAAPERRVRWHLHAGPAWVHSRHLDCDDHLGDPLWPGHWSTHLDPAWPTVSQVRYSVVVQGPSATSGPIPVEPGVSRRRLDARHVADLRAGQARLTLLAEHPAWTGGLTVVGDFTPGDATSAPVLRLGPATAADL
jgi:hypothetical protein